MSNSILNDIKHLLGLDESYDVFDTDITIHINSVFMTLNQLGVGPKEPFHISSITETWEEFTQGSVDISAVKTYIYLKVRLLFDPPTNSFTITALENQAKEFEWRLLAQSDVNSEEAEGKPTSPSNEAMEPLTKEEIDAMFANKDLRAGLRRLKKTITAPSGSDSEGLSIADIDKMFKERRKR